jgi:hypothetical protein
MRWLFLPLAILVLVTLAPASALGHAERLAYYPDYREGKVPEYRTTGKALVVCKRDSKARIKRIRGTQRMRKVRRRSLRLLKSCDFRHIQAAVDAATNGTRILVLPGVYREQPSRAIPEPDPRCAGDYEEYGNPDSTATGETVRVTATTTSGSAPTPRT